MRTKALVLVVLGAAVAAAGASAVSSAPPPTSPAKVDACNSGRIGFLGPLTGPFSTIGREQLNWAKLALDMFNTANGTHFALKQGDTRLVPKLALKAGAAFAADKSLLATIGPTGSHEVMAVGKLFASRGLPGVLSSATSVPLSGNAYPTFSRVVGGNAVQGRSDGLFMVEKLHAKKVVIVDDRGPYSTLVADSAAKVLKANGVQVKRQSVSQTVSDFSPLLTKIASDTDVIFLPWQIASNAQLFAQQLADQGGTAKLVGSDGLDSEQFVAVGAYVSTFARDIRGLPVSAPVISAYETTYGTKWSLFGPPTYVAAQVVATAYKAACADGKATRAELIGAIRAVKLQRTILGIPITFDRHGEVPAARYYVSQIQSDGKRKLVW
jgi:branched-chain amino acid transport system substrate-binding protein